MEIKRLEGLLLESLQGLLSMVGEAISELSRDMKKARKSFKRFSC